MPYRVCRRFTVESGHMLSRHPESCRFPHGHTRDIEFVVEADTLDENGMVCDFKALKMALEAYVDRYDHSMAINSQDPFLGAFQTAFPEQAVVLFENAEPTTEAIARDLYDFGARILRDGFRGTTANGNVYAIPAGRCRLVRVRVWETPKSWAEYAPPASAWPGREAYD